MTPDYSAGEYSPHRVIDKYPNINRLIIMYWRETPIKVLIVATCALGLTACHAVQSELTPTTSANVPQDSISCTSSVTAWAASTEKFGGEQITATTGEPSIEITEPVAIEPTCAFTSPTGKTTVELYVSANPAVAENTYAQFVQAASQSSHLDLATRSTNPSGATFMSDTNSEITQVSIRIADKRFMDYMGYSPSVNMVIVSSVTQKR